MLQKSKKNASHRGGAKLHGALTQGQSNPCQFAFDTPLFPFVSEVWRLLANHKAGLVPTGAT
jgi:hypothetical protein